MRSISLSDFNAYVVALAMHDWAFEFADDNREYKAGKAKQTELLAKAFADPVLSKAYTCYSASQMCTTGSLLKRIEHREGILDGLRKQVTEAQLVAA